MPIHHDHRISPKERRRGLNLGIVNGVLWSVGNGLTTGPVILYLALDLGSKGLELSLLLATPWLAGIFRLVAPEVIHWTGSAKRTCVQMSLASYVLLMGLPLIGFLPKYVDKRTALIVMITLVCVHQLLEFVATVALWTWLADLVPLPIRGRYFARRQMWQLAVLIPTLVAGGKWVDVWRDTFKESRPDLLPLAYSIPTAIGVLCLLASILPLAIMPATSSLPWRHGSWLSALAQPFRDRRFARLLEFRTWFSFANGISQTAQGIYPRTVLVLGVLDLQIMRIVMQVGQMLASPMIGKLSDRIGNRPIIMACQGLTAAAMLFFIFATREHPWVLLGAWILFIAYVGHNICMPNLMLKLSPADKAPYVAAHEALAGIFHAVATVLGGILLDWLTGQSKLTESSLTGINSFAAVFWLGLVLRALAILLMARVQENPVDSIGANAK